jgi:NCS1 family nucleobase:cation symporter-1
VALAAGIAPNIPGFLSQAPRGSIQVAPIFDALYVYAWFVGLLISGAVHLVLTRMFPVQQTDGGETSVQAAAMTKG